MALLYRAFAEAEQAAADDAVALRPKPARIRQDHEPETPAEVAPRERLKSKFSSVSRVSHSEDVGEPLRLGAVILRYGSSVAPMRLPPLPSPPKPLTPEQMARRVVGDRPAEVTAPITVSPYDPEWPSMYAREEFRIRSALGSRVLAVDHVGSTAVPCLPAKDRIDIDLIVADPAAEDAYVPALAATGYTLRTREPHWYEHRCLWNADHSVNLHVFGPDCDEYLRHVIFRDWLRTHPEDRDRYAARKFEAAAEHPLSMAHYVAGKGQIVVEILQRAGLR